MTREDIVALADEVGITVEGAAIEWLERFAQLVIEREREECAAICEAKAEHWWLQWRSGGDPRVQGLSDGADECGQAIRSRT